MVDVQLSHPLPGGQMTSGWGDGRNHNGVDFAAPRGTPVTAAHMGFVKYAGMNSGSGYGIVVYIEFTGQFQTRYAHLSSTNVSVGDGVEAGDIIGRVGSTGDSTGPHLHFELLRGGKKIDPTPYLHGQGLQLDVTPDAYGDTPEWVKGFGALSDILEFITNPKNWYRVGLFLLGIVLVVAGAIYFARGNIFSFLGEQIVSLFDGKGKRK